MKTHPANTVCCIFPACDILCGTEGSGCVMGLRSPLDLPAVFGFRHLLRSWEWTAMLSAVQGCHWPRRDRLRLRLLYIRYIWNDKVVFFISITCFFVWKVCKLPFNNTFWLWTGTLLCVCLVWCNLAVIRVLCRSSKGNDQRLLVRRISRTSNKSKPLSASNLNHPIVYNAATADEIAFSKLMATLSVCFIICWMPQMVKVYSCSYDVFVHEIWI